MEKLQNMDSCEKNKFLSMDLAERMIRVEQNVSASFNKDVPYNKTEYYKSMSPEERKCFEEYLKNKGKKKTMIVAGFFVSLFVFLIVNLKITGNAIRGAVDINAIGIFNLILIILIFVLALYLFFSYLHRKHKHRRAHKHIKVLENIMMTKDKKGVKARFLNKR